MWLCVCVLESVSVFVFMCMSMFVCVCVYVHVCVAIFGKKGKKLLNNPRLNPSKTLQMAMVSRILLESFALPRNGWIMSCKAR